MTRIMTLTIESLRDGGFLIYQASGGTSHFNPMLFACTTLEEALDYIHRSLTKPANTAQE